MVRGATQRPTGAWLSATATGEKRSALELYELWGATVWRVPPDGETDALCFALPSRAAPEDALRRLEHWVVSDAAVPDSVRERRRQTQRAVLERTAAPELLLHSAEPRALLVRWQVAARPCVFRDSFPPRSFDT